MAASAQPGSSAPAPDEIAARLRDAGLVRLVAVPEGDGVAAVGLLGRALADCDTAFQATIAAFPEPSATDADCTVTAGRDGGDIALVGPTPASATAFAVARELDTDVDPLLALAGTVAAGHEPGETDAGILEAARDRGLSRRPGIAVPTTDLDDGLAHTTLAHAPFSGDIEAARAALADRGLPTDRAEMADGDDRRVASLLALSVATDDAAPRAAESVERALHPYVGGPLGTVAGYVDVLECVARERPGTAVVLALGHDVHQGALGAWRAHATAAHDAVREASVSRHSGLLVTRTDGPVATVARMVRDFRSPEPTVVAVADGEAAAASTGSGTVAPALDEAARTAGGEASGGDRTAYARFAATETKTFLAALREVL